MNFKEKSFRKALVLIFSGILFWWGLENMTLLVSATSYIIGLFRPFIVGAAIAFIFNVPMRSIEKRLFSKSQKLKKARRPISYLIVLVALTTGLIVATAIIVPELGRTLNLLAIEIPAAIGELEKLINSNIESLKQIGLYVTDLNFDWDSFTATAVTFVQGIAQGLIDTSFSAVSGVISGVTTFVVGFVFSIYLLMQKETLGMQVRKAVFAILPEKSAKQFFHIQNMASEAFGNFLTGQCLEAVIIGVFFFIAMTIFKFPYALLISMIIAIMALIPIVGAFIGCGIGVLLILIVNPFQALMFIILFLVIQQIEGNLIYPFVVGNSVGLPSIWVLVSVMIGGSLMGVVGMLVFIPLNSVLYALFRTWVHKRLEEKELAPNDYLAEQAVQDK